MAGAHIWIMDGHNIIFAVPRLKDLQTSDRGDEARRNLVDDLRRFAGTRRQKVLVVFDGIDLPGNPDAVGEAWIEVVYWPRRRGGADPRILDAAAAGLERGDHVTVVTDDVQTLAGRLPRGVRHLAVVEFWRRHIDRPPGPEEKVVGGDFSDVERALEAMADGTEAATTDRRPAPAQPPPSRVTAAETRHRQIRLKRDKGRRRQERRLRRHARAGRAR